MSIAAAALDAAEPTVTPETAPETATPETAKPDPRMDLIAKLERKNKIKEQEYNAKLKEIEEKASRYGKYESVEAMIKQNPLAALKELGFEGGLEDLNKWALENLEDEDLDPVAKRFKEIESKLAEKDKEYEEKLRAAIEAKEKEIAEKQNEYQIKEFKLGIKSFLDQNKEAYEFLYSQPEAGDLVYEVIYEDVLRQQKAGKQDIVPMEMKEAAEKLEKYLDAQLEPLLKSKKIQSKFTKPDNWMDKYANRQATITEDMTALSHASAEELTPAERAQLAIKKLKEGKYPQE